MAKNPEEMARSMIANLPEKTGRSMKEWLALLEGRQGDKHGVLVKHLKSDHGVTHGFANLIAHTVRGGVTAEGARAADSDDLVEAQYAGRKAELRPIYDRLVEIVKDFGEDVEIAPKNTTVSLRRAKQFACIEPATHTRVDLGVQLKGQPGTDRLAELKPGSMTTHNVRIETLEGVDNEVVAWLRAAYVAAS